MGLEIVSLTTIDVMFVTASYDDDATVHVLVVPVGMKKNGTTIALVVTKLLM